MENISQAIASIEGQLSEAKTLLQQLRESRFDDQLVSGLLVKIRAVAHAGMELSMDTIKGLEQQLKRDDPLRMPLISRLEALYGDCMQVQSDASVAAATSITGISAYEELQALLRSLRKAAGLTLEQLAEKIGSNKSTLNHYETGRSNPDIEKIAAWADACGYKASIWFRPKDSVNLPELVGSTVAALPRRDQEILLRISTMLEDLLISPDFEQHFVHSLVQDLLLAIDKSLDRGTDAVRNAETLRETKWDNPHEMLFDASEAPTIAADQFLMFWTGLRERDGRDYALALRLMLEPVGPDDHRMLIQAIEEGWKQPGEEGGPNPYVELLIDRGRAVGLTLNKRSDRLYERDEYLEKLNAERDKLKEKREVRARSSSSSPGDDLK